MTTKSPHKIPTVRSRRLRKSSLNKIQNRLITVLVRETESLMDLSFNHKLDKNDAASLVNYLRLLKEMRKDEEDKNKNLTDEELEKIAAQALTTTGPTV